MLKKIRITVSAAVLVVFLLFFTGLWEINYRLSGAFTYFQFVPSFVKFFSAGFLLAGSGFIIVLVSAAIFGRIYCSSLCPLGTLQDIFIYIRYKTGKKRGFKPEKNYRALRYTAGAAAFIPVFFGSGFVISLLDPFSNFGRIAVNIINPVVVFLTSKAAVVFENFNIHIVPHVKFNTAAPGVVAGALLFFAAIGILSFYRGRIFCNTLCPAGAVLGLVSKKSLYGIKINTDECAGCGLCAAVCKAGCIDCESGGADNERCVACFNCISACSRGSISYGKAVPVKADEGRRSAVKVISGFIAAAVVFFQGKTGLFAQASDSKILVQKKNPVIPPGGVSAEHFNSTCTACHLCVAACPTKVLVPASLEYGISGIFQPKMDYFSSYCLYECALCTQVCPTGALIPLSKNEKKKLQIGRVNLIKENCVGWGDLINCNICDEYCPTKAVRAKPHPDKPSINVPYIDPDTCVGCGACENVCPAAPHKAIYVEGSTLHGEAEKPRGARQRRRNGRGKSAVPAARGENDFPF